MNKGIKDNKKLARIIKVAAIVFGFVLGFLAYLPFKGKVDDIQTLSDVIYHTIDLMTGAKPVTGANSGLINWARFVCPTATLIFALTFFSNWLNKVAMICRSFVRDFSIWGKQIFKDSVAIYGSNDLVKAAAEGTHFIQAGDYFLKHAKKHIILMDNDEESLQFFKKHEAELSRDIIHIGLQQMSTFLMKGMPNVAYFNVYEEVARRYWKEHSILTAMEADNKYDMVILGYRRDNLGYQLLKYGLLNNIFRKDQNITYHIFCEPGEERRGFESFYRALNGTEPGSEKNFELLNDNIIWHTEPWQDRLELIRSVNRVILCRAVHPYILNQLLPLCVEQQIHCYNPDDAFYPENYGHNYITAFGCTKNVLNGNAILKSELYRDAMERHFQYTEKYGSDKEKAELSAATKDGFLEEHKLKLWNNLTGFLKNSNCFVADYYTMYPVRSGLTDTEIEERAELEHIRWCRFHFLCGWKYGEPINGERRDKEKRIHRALISWDELPEKEKEKDRQQVLVEQKRK